MSKEIIVSDAVAAIKAGQDQLLVDAIGAACDKMALEQKASDGTLSQGDLDAAVAQALADKDAADAAVLQAQKDADAQALIDALKPVQDQLAAAQAELDGVKAERDAAVAKDGVDAPKAVLFDGLQASVAALQAALAALQPIVSPVV